jgi:H+-transporting ATPase
MIIVKSFIPFDPTTKRTEVTYEDKSTGSVHRVTKGMPEVILRLCNTTQSESSEQSIKMRSDVKEFARRGFRSLAIAIDKHGANFQLIGLLPIFDPPRQDTADTIMKAIELGRTFSLFL